MENLSIDSAKLDRVVYPSSGAARLLEGLM